MNMDNAERQDAVNEKLSQEMGFDVESVEAQARFRIDLIRIQRGEPSELSYVLIERRNHPNVAVVFPAGERATTELLEHPVVQELTAEDTAAVFTPETVSLSDLAGREVIII